MEASVQLDLLFEWFNVRHAPLKIVSPRLKIQSRVVFLKTPVISVALVTQILTCYAKMSANIHFGLREESRLKKCCL